MAAPIIVPIVTHSQRDCIVQDGVRYCERGNESPQDFGFVLLGLFAFGCWLAFWFWLGDKYESIGIVFAGAFGLPLLIGGLLLIIFF